VAEPAVRIEERSGAAALATPAAGDVDLAAWCAANGEAVRGVLDRAGGIRFRGFAPATLPQFRGLFTALCPEVMEYQDRSSPRSTVEERLYTSTHHPADQRIRMHCELSYSHEWPRMLGFFCVHPSESGGETPLADTRRVLGLLSPATRERFAAKGVRYRRNLRQGIGLSWGDVFGTASREEVERRCAARGIACDWRGDDLRIEWVRPAIAVHPRTGESVWFNHAAFFHPRALDAEVAAALESEEQLPFRTSYGDGTAIDDGTFEEIEAAYRMASVVEPWEAGDVVILDNLLTAHGRMPFRGRRELFVMMGDAARGEA
jgi:alpha-ketoglutarate-dependent taurine dioxygenase